MAQRQNQTLLPAIMIAAFVVVAIVSITTSTISSPSGQIFRSSAPAAAVATHVTARGSSIVQYDPNDPNLDIPALKKKAENLAIEQEWIDRDKQLKAICMNGFKITHSEEYPQSKQHDSRHIVWAAAVSKYEYVCL